jgi:hypothetical protein
MVFEDAKIALQPDASPEGVQTKKRFDQRPRINMSHH